MPACFWREGIHTEQKQPSHAHKEPYGTALFYFITPHQRNARLGPSRSRTSFEATSAVGEEAFVPLGVSRLGRRETGVDVKQSTTHGCRLEF